MAEGSVIGQQIFSGDTSINKYSLKKGSSLILRDINLFGVVSQIESRPYFGAALARAAGVGAVIVASTSNFITLKLRSG